MKLNRLVIFSGSLLLTTSIFTGCATPPPSKPEPKCTALTGAPNWVINPTVPDGIGVVGISGPNTGGIAFQTDTARGDAYHKAGNVIKTIVIATLDLLRKSTKVAGINETKEIMKNVTALEVNEIPTAGIQRSNVWISSCTGDYFANYTMADRSIKSNLKDTLKQVNASETIIKDSMEELSQEIDKIKENARANR